MNKVLLRPLFRKKYLEKNKKPEVKKFNVGGLSRVEKQNLLLTPITSALLQARKAPGESELGALARTFGKGIETLPATALAIKKQELAAREAADESFASTKTVFDQDLGKNVLATEKQIQTVMSVEKPGEKRFIPKEEPEKRGAPKKVFDTETQSKAFVSASEIYDVMNSKGEPRYIPVEEQKTPIAAYRINEDGTIADTKSFVPVDEIISNPEAFVPAEGNLEAILKVDEIKRKAKAKTDAETNMIAARAVGSIIRKLEDDINKKGAFTGTAGDAVLNIAGVTGFVDQFVNKQKEADPRRYAEERRQLDEAVFKLTDKESPTFNARVTRFLNAPETQASKTSVLDLAYAIAKAREPGGRFSVSDIELALRAIGDSSNKEVFLSGLKRLGEQITENALFEYETRFNVTRNEIPKGFSEVVDQYNYFSGVPLDTGSDEPDELEFD